MSNTACCISLINGKIPPDRRSATYSHHSRFPLNTIPFVYFIIEQILHGGKAIANGQMTGRLLECSGLLD